MKAWYVRGQISKGVRRPGMFKDKFPKEGAFPPPPKKCIRESTRNQEEKCLSTYAEFFNLTE